MVSPFCCNLCENLQRAREQREATGVAPLKPLSLAEHQELVTVTIPQQLLPKIDFETTFELGLLFEEVSNAVPGAAGQRVCIGRRGSGAGGGVCGVPFVTFGVGGQLGWRQGTEQEDSQGPPPEICGCARNPCSNSTQVRLTGCEATTGQCNQLRSLICSPPVTWTERGKQRKHTGKAFVSPSDLQIISAADLREQTSSDRRGEGGGDSCMQLLSLLRKHTHWVEDSQEAS